MTIAATADTAGAAMLVPEAQVYVLVLAPLPRDVLSTMSNTQQGAVADPDGYLGSVQASFPG
jgi:hypothetical protein